MSSDKAPASPKPEETSTTTTAPVEQDTDKTSKDYYFDSYSHYGIHQEMLQDTVRTETYMKSIMENKHLFKGKIVLDVGCGTGILSMFAAKAGAKHVIGIDCADILDSARIIVKENGFDDKITLLKGKLEELTLPDGIEKVDIIISEWMGYFLLYESMLDTVLYARDKWLAPGGMLFPDKATLFIAALEDSEYRESKIDYWDNVYGFNMAPLKAQMLDEPMVDIAHKEQVISQQAKILDIDLYKVTKEELDFESKFRVVANRTDTLHGFISYFACEFTKCAKPTRFHTSPAHKRTHWKQTIFYLHEPNVVKEGEVINGFISVKRNDKNPRDLDIHLTSQIACTDKDPIRGAKQSHNYRLR
jgi:protein arginine N-methyltransferase 1